MTGPRLKFLVIRVGYFVYHTNHALRLRSNVLILIPTGSCRNNNVCLSKLVASNVRFEYKHSPRYGRICQSSLLTCVTGFTEVRRDSAAWNLNTIRCS
ncbi:hypothetical protein BDN70DRAFT_587921 [Pholiota conissans]|uniref:Uncharacterized protein n=1 Tax=Pholiota conissans TaxID=109636 RepID=A0A9P5ZCB3_9AGAR|nr:hypothetical protein BDN70DRAFT_587921 [Pholiota conissans]